MHRIARIAIVIQGIYYAVTGVWPLVSIETFEWVTGPKMEHWLVQTVGVLVLAIALGLLVGAMAGRLSRETLTLGIASACGFATVDVVFYALGRIGAVYLVDAAVQAVFALVLLGEAGPRALGRRAPSAGA